MQDKLKKCTLQFKSYLAKYLIIQDIKVQGGKRIFLVLELSEHTF